MYNGGKGWGPRKLINLYNKSDVVIIVVHEIYGINQHMRDICHSLFEEGFDVVCPNLLNQESTFDYSEEKIAYDNFMEKIGFANALDKIKIVLSDIRDKYKKVFVIGFSVGATVAWLCTEEEHLDGMVGYYGSRIRSYMDFIPVCPTLLFFPQKEQSFNVDKLISSLKGKNIEIHKLNGQHGFSDPYSPKYNEGSAQKAFGKIVDFIMKH